MFADVDGNPVSIYNMLKKQGLTRMEIAKFSEFAVFSELGKVG
jgi:hypothetical protein